MKPSIISFVFGGSKGAAPLLTAREWGRCNVVKSPPFTTAGLKSSQIDLTLCLYIDENDCVYIKYIDCVYLFMSNVYIQKTNCLYINLGMSIHEAMVYIDSWFFRCYWHYIRHDKDAL